MSHLSGLAHHAAAAINDPEYLDACKVVASTFPEGVSSEDMNDLFIADPALRGAVWRIVARNAVCVILDRALKVGKQA